MQADIKKIFFKNKQTITSISVITLAFVIGYGIGIYKEKAVINGFIKSFRNIRQSSDRYPMIDPLLGVTSAPATDVGVYVDLQNDVVEYLNEKKASGELYDYSIYFKDLDSPLWFGVNEETSFVPASLFKIPIALTIYKQGENNPSFLEKRVVYTNEVAKINENENTEVSSLIVGNSYTIEELVTIMLELSDNGAKNLLISNLDVRYIKDLFRVMLLVDPLSQQGYEISSRKYALFLRLLYNSSYLNEEHSNYILTLLSKSTFKDGLVAGLPAGIDVAHKFGTYTEINGRYSVLHDCGIVYVADDPYVVCIMTKGKNIPSLLKVISHVSKMIYEGERE